MSENECLSVSGPAVSDDERKERRLADMEREDPDTVEELEFMQTNPADYMEAVRLELRQRLRLATPSPGNGVICHIPQLDAFLCSICRDGHARYLLIGSNGDYTAEFYPSYMSLYVSYECDLCPYSIIPENDGSGGRSRVCMVCDEPTAGTICGPKESLRLSLCSECHLNPRMLASIGNPDKASDGIHITTRYIHGKSKMIGLKRPIARSEGR